VHNAIDGQEFRDCRLDEKSLDRSQLVPSCTRSSRGIPLDVDKMMMPMVDLVLVVSVFSLGQFFDLVSQRRFPVVRE
jgi:hypothetical protein